jgi:hypothetical protein
MNLNDIVDNEFDSVIKKLNDKRELNYRREIELLRIIWEPSLKKDIKELEKYFGCKEEELNIPDKYKRERKELIDDLSELLRDKISKKDFDLFIKNCWTDYSFMDMYNKKLKIEELLGILFKTEIRVKIK